MASDSQVFDRQLPDSLALAFTAVAGASPDGVGLLDSRGRIVAANLSLARLLGRSMRDLGGAELAALVAGEPLPDLTAGDTARRFTSRLAAGDGADGTVTVEVTVSSLQAGRESRDMVVIRRLAGDEPAPGEHHYRDLFEQSRDVLYVTDDDDVIVEINPAAEDLFGWSRTELAGRRLASLFADVGEWDRFRLEIEREGEVRDLEVRLTRSTDDELHCLISSSQRRDGAGRVVGRQGIVHDVTVRKLAEERLWRAAIHDTLTGLPNRGVFIDRLQRSIGRARRRDDYKFAVLFLDLDRFKVVNDTFGHVAGDGLLVDAARRIESAVRPEDTLARIGGDEFAVLLYNVYDPAYAQHIAERIQDRLREPFDVDGTEVRITASVGIALSTGSYSAPEDVLREADVAMYRAKREGLERYAFFEPSMHEAAAHRAELEKDIRLAVARDQLLLHYQPLVSLADRRLQGFEALVRWNHPTRGLMPPAQFIPLAEELELIEEIDGWVLGEACRQMRQWHDAPGGDRLTINVNISGEVFLRSDLARRVDRVLEETGLDPRCLRIEVTENVVLHNVDVVSQHFQALKKRGVQLCIDDFGIGYSSLSYLSRFPIDVLKIDRTFVESMEAHASSREIVRAIVTLARNLGLEAIAEGAETDGQIESLHELGSHFAQGFLFSRPVDAETAEALIKKGRGFGNDSAGTD